MDLAASYRFNAPRDHVWNALMNTTVIASCMPGCKELRPIGEDRYQADLVAGVAAVSGEFRATIGIEDKHQPESYTLVMDAKGRPGFVKGRARITLTDDGTGTRIDIAATADAGGAIARFGQRLMEGVARMTMDRFYGCLGRHIEGTAPESTPA